MGIAGDLALIVVAALLGGVLAHFLRLPLVLGYILAGIAVGPNTRGPTVADPHEIELLADIGVAFLLFTVGLEFSPARLKPVGKITLFGTPIQLGLCILLGWVIAWGLGYPGVQGIWLGCLLSLSSTMVSLKLLLEQGFSQALSGRVMLGMLVVQDMASIPMMVILPTLGKADNGASALLMAGLKAVALVAVMLTFGARILPGLLRLVLRSGSHELFLVTIVGVALGIGYLSHLSGLSFALGAFLAGLVLSESDYSHHALGTVGPFRDLFGMLFFVSVGMLVQPGFLWQHLGQVALLLPLILLGKGLILGGVALAFGYRNILPFALACGLTQIGEFSFVLARAGIQSGGLSPQLYDFVLILAVLSMALTPFLMRLPAPLYRQWRKRVPARQPESAESENQEVLQDHIIIGGYGRVGRQIAAALTQQGYPCQVCERDWANFQAAQADLIPAIFGDLAAESVLEALHIGSARQVVLTFNDPGVLNVVVTLIRSLRAELPIVAEASSRGHAEELRALGVDHVVLPAFESAVEFIRLALVRSGCDANQTTQILEQTRASTYAISPKP